jgi:WD40 repeat protein
MGYLVSVWDSATNELVAELPHGPPDALAFSPDARQLVSGGMGEQIELTDLETMQTRTWPAGQGPLASLAVDATGRTLASGGDDGTLVIWNLSDGSEWLRWPAHSGRVTALAFHPRQPLLASGGIDGTVRLWSLERLEDRLEAKGLGDLERLDASRSSPRTND